MLLTDIDDRKRAEDALRSNEQSLRLTVDSIPGFVSTMSAAGDAEFVSRQVLEYFGKTIEELKNWAANDTLHPDDLPHMIDAWSRALKTGQPFELESRRRRADGVYRWFHLRSRPQRDAEGRIVRWYNLTTDIDERKRAEDALRRTEAYLSEAQHLSRFESAEAANQFPSTCECLPQRTATWKLPLLAVRSARIFFIGLTSSPYVYRPLRERNDDIPLLVEYLVERYAKRAGKKISHIKKNTLDLFQTYDWPGNIRELQNVVERAVTTSPTA